jgi:hypothetical protein
MAKKFMEECSLFPLGIIGGHAMALKRDVVVLLPRVFELLVAQHLQRPGDALARASL